MAYMINQFDGISSKVSVYTHELVASHGYPRTFEHVTGIRNNPQQKQISERLAMVPW